MVDQLKANVKEIIELSPTAKAIRLEFNEKIKFLPGQFLMLEFNIDEDRLEVKEEESTYQRRAFSISSTPSEKLIEITVKKTQQPFVSEYLVDHLKIGDEVLSSEPKGKFIFNPKKETIFLAAGSGIAPIMSMIRFLDKKKSKIKAHLIYSNKISEDILWKNDIESASKNNKSFTYEFILTKDSKRISESHLKEFMKNKEVNFYICGPLEFVRDLYNLLIQNQISKENIKIEIYE